MSRSKINISTFPFTYNLKRNNFEKSVPLRRNDVVQLYDNSLLRIEHFESYSDSVSGAKEKKNEIYVSGTVYRRFKDCADFGGFLRNSSQEVYEDQSASNNERRHHVDFISRKVTLVRTNTSYPFAENKTNKERFVCRYRHHGDSLERLSIRQTDEGETRWDERVMRNLFIHGTEIPSHRNPRLKYRFGDAFCGVGGCSSGAKAAGLNVIWAFDKEEDTRDIYAKNFRDTETYAQTVDEFISGQNRKPIDILHLSPPCQPWSYAHTTIGRNDEANSSALFAVDRLLDIYRPRVATLEQVPGLAQIECNKYSLKLAGLTEGLISELA